MNVINCAAVAKLMGVFFLGGVRLNELWLVSGSTLSSSRFPWRRYLRYVREFRPVSSALPLTIPTGTKPLASGAQGEQMNSQKPFISSEGRANPGLVRPNCFRGVGSSSTFLGSENPGLVRPNCFRGVASSSTFHSSENPGLARPVIWTPRVDATSIGQRSSQFSEILDEISPRVQALFSSAQPMLLQMHLENVSESIEAKYRVSWLGFDV